MPKRQEGPPGRRIARRIIAMLVPVALLGISGLLVYVALEEPEDTALQPAEEPQPTPARPVRPFMVDGARALPNELPPLAEAELRPGQLPEIEVHGVKLRREGHVTWLDDPLFENILHNSVRGLSDGVSLYYTPGNRSNDRDILLRNGEIYTDILRQLGVDSDRGSCHDVRAGRLLLVSRGDDGLTAWLFGHIGPIQRIDLGIDERRSFGCEAHLDENGHFVVQADRRATWDGARITHAVATTKLFAPTRFNTSAACTPACSPYEREPKTEAFADQIDAALGCEAHFQLEGAWLLGRCERGGPLARAALDGPCCEHQQLPADPDRLDETLTRNGDAALIFRDRTLQLWSTDGGLGPREPIGDDDHLSMRGPALRIRGLPWIYVAAIDTSNPPSAATPWVVPRTRSMPLMYSGAGKTKDTPASAQPVSDEEAQRRRTEIATARASISEDSLKAATRAFGDELDLLSGRDVVVDRRCGHVVWLDEHYFHTMPSSDPTITRSTTRAPQCRRLSDFTSLRGEYPDFGLTLIARTRRGELALAWRPATADDREIPWAAIGRSDEPSPPPFHGWVDLGVRGSMDDDPSWDDLSDIATLRVDDKRLVINGTLVHTLPLDAKPLRVRRNVSLLAAQGDQVIVCAPECRSLDPGLGRPVTAAVLINTTPPRLLLRAGDDAHGLVHSGAPTRELQEHPLAAKLRERFAHRDRERREFAAEYARWAAKVKEEEKEKQKQEQEQEQKQAKEER